MLKGRGWGFWYSYAKWTVSCDGGSQGMGLTLASSCLSLDVKCAWQEQGNSTRWTLTAKPHSVAQAAKEPSRDSDCSLGLSLVSLSQLSFLISVLISEWSGCFRVMTWHDVIKLPRVERQVTPAEADQGPRKCPCLRSTMEIVISFLKEDHAPSPTSSWSQSKIWLLSKLCHPTPLVKGLSEQWPTRVKEGHCLWSRSHAFLHAILAGPYHNQTRWLASSRPRSSSWAGRAGPKKTRVRHEETTVGGKETTGGASWLCLHLVIISWR